ncbi:unnamed protein product [Polarella glacialis]|uniref:Ion transport domain-containing protein n=1 Tax=Polarella glacialis TaxID=89957 RepID=A0A813FFC4_POLGL|nr:unnamed protein product [Polarella glacialis]CAE8640881.1 unnamed protein product [Polarella glacialis]
MRPSWSGADFAAPSASLSHSRCTWSRHMAPAITAYEGNQVMFYISGMAFLTLIFNATTCPNLLKFLRITQPSATTRKMLLWVHGRLIEQAAEHEQDCCAAGAEIMHWVLDDVKHHVETMPTHDDEDKVQSDNALKSCFRNLLAQKPKAVQCARPAELVQDFENALQEYKAVSHILKERMPKLPESTLVNKRKVLVNSLVLGLADPLNSQGYNSPPAEKSAAAGKSKVASVMVGVPSTTHKNGQPDDELDEDAVLDHIGVRPMSFDPLFMVAARNAFMELVRASYWEQIADGSFGQHGRGRAEAVLHSVEGTIASNEGKLNDLTFLQQELEPLSLTPDEDEPKELETSGMVNGVRRLAKSERFKTIVSISFVISVIIDIIWDSMKQNEYSHNLHSMWLGLEIALLLFFILEQSVRLFAYRMAYFKKVSNVFDGLLFLLIVVGIGLELDGKNTWLFTADFWVFRLIRVFRCIVPTRVADAIQFWQQLKKKFSGRGFSAEQAQCMEHILMNTAYCKAHVHAQHEFVEFFGRQHMPLPGEQACVILESHTLVYKASVAALKAATSLDQEALDDINILREGSSAVENMRKFISHAQEQNVISSSAAETLMEPMVHKQRDWINHIHGVELGTNSPGEKNLLASKKPDQEAMDRSESGSEASSRRAGAPKAKAKAKKYEDTWSSCLKFWE